MMFLVGKRRHAKSLSQKHCSIIIDNRFLQLNNSNDTLIKTKPMFKIAQDKFKTKRSPEYHKHKQS